MTEKTTASKKTTRKAPAKASKVKKTAGRASKAAATKAEPLQPRPAPKRKAPKSRTPSKKSTTKRKSAQPRRRSGSLRRLARRLPWRSLSILAVVTAVISGGHWLWQSGKVEAAADSLVEGVYEVTADAGFAVTSIQLLGRSETGEAAVLQALETERGAAILRFDPEAARARVEALPWVETATIERRLPNRILATISEKRPVALWQSNGEWSVIDAEGLVIAGAPAGAFHNLPKLVGEGAEQHVAEILALTKSQPNLASRVYAAIRVGDRRWNLRLHSGIDVRLPENDMISAWERLAQIESVADLLSRDVTVIDLRRSDRLLLRLAPDAEIEQPVEGQET